MAKKKRFNKATEIRTATDTYKRICEEITDAWWGITDFENWLSDNGYKAEEVNWNAYPDAARMMEKIHITDDAEELEDVIYIIERILSNDYYDEPEEGYEIKVGDCIQYFRDMGLELIPLYFEEKSKVWKSYMTYLGALGKVELADEFMKAYAGYESKESLWAELRKRDLYSDIEQVLNKYN